MAKIPYTKPCISPLDQVKLLKSRGIVIKDHASAEHYLRYHNYYQLSGYIYYFEQKGTVRTHLLARPVSFDDIITLVRFDKMLRENFFSVTSEIEIAIRCSISYNLSRSNGPFCFEDPSIFRNSCYANVFCEKLKKALADHKNEPFIAHHTNTYQERIPPAWVMVEVLTFGNISWLFSKLRTDLQKNIASDFFVDHSVFVSWLKALTELRNTCAHHMRLWNKVFVNYPKIRKADKSFPFIPGMESRLASFLPMVFHLLSVLGERPGWNTDLTGLLASMPLIKPDDMGLQVWPDV